MKEIPHGEWAPGGRIQACKFPNQYAEPLKLSFDGWKDASDPLGSLLEVLRFAMAGPAYGVPPSVFAGQIFLESDMGRAQDVLLGIKATKSDIEKGTWKELKTHEEVDLKELDRLRITDKLVKIVRTITNDRFLVQCLQKFHYEPGLVDDFERYFRYYERREPERQIYLRSGPQRFLEKVTVGPPWKYATDSDYTDKVMAKVNAYKLEVLDCVIPS